MASRKDKKGRVLRKGEAYRESRDLYSYSYIDSKGKRQYIYSRSLIKLREKERELLRDELDGIDTAAANSVTLNYMFDLYMQTKSDLRESTRVNYMDCYRRYVRSGFGKKKIASIKFTDVLVFYSDLLTEKKLHISTIKYLQRLIRPAFELAVRDNIIRSNPADGIIRMLNRNNIRESTLRNALTIEQQRAFLRYVAKNPTYQRLSPFFVFMFGTGCRIGEVIGLRWEDVDLEKKIIDINHSITYLANRKNDRPTGWLLNDPKTEAGKRTIPMVDAVYEALLEEKAKQEELNQHCITEIAGYKNFIFFNRNLDVYIPEGVNREIHRIVNSYNKTETAKALAEGREPELLPHFSNHYIRHTFCTRLCEADMNIKAIQSVMGHRDIQTTLDIYAEVSENKKKESLKKVFKDMKLF